MSLYSSSSSFGFFFFSIPPTTDTYELAPSFSLSLSSFSYNWKRIKGFLFDIDGTLCDTDPLHLVAFRDCLKKAGIKQEVDETFFKANISGRSNPDIARYVPSHLNERPFSFEAFRKRKYSDRRIIIIIIFSGFQRDLLPHLSEEEKEQWIVDKEEYFCNLARKEIRPVEGLVELVSW